jgi:HAMP domain-containing protein
LIKKIKGSLFIKVFITTAILLTGVSFLVYLILAWYTPKTYSNTLNATLDEQTKIFISEISQMPMEETGGIFDNFLDYQNVDRMELFEENGNRINLPTERSADNDVVIETKAWGNEDNNAPIISNSYTVSFLGKNTNYTLVVYGAAGQVAELQRAFQKVFPLLAFIVFCVSLVTGWIFSHLITKPVLKISRISKEMSELQFEWQLDEQRTDELGILAKSLNYLSQKLNVTLNDLQAANRKLELDIEHEKALEQARTNFFSAVSHELKTPITIIKGQLEGIPNVSQKVVVSFIYIQRKDGVYFMSTKKLLTLALGSALLVGVVAGCSSSVNIPSDNNTTKNVSYQAQTVSDTENAANDSTTAELPGGSVDYSIYEPYGLSYDQENYYFTYNGNVVRFFNDPIAGASFTNFFSGTVDIEADRDEENNLVGIKECSKENYDRHTQKHNNFNPTDTSLSTVQKGESTPQLWLKDYADYGITYNEQSGGWYYNNQRIKILLDSEQAVVYTDEENGVCVTISRDGNHQISEIKEISETDAQSLMLKNNPIGEDYTSQE